MINSKSELTKIIKKWFKNLKNCETRPFLRFISRKIFSLFPHDGVNVMDEQWDYLIVLDACRYDAFKKVNDLPGNLKKKLSQGSHTTEWLRKNFKDFYENTIYVSGNPMVSHVKIRGRIVGGHFYKIEEVWRDGWDEEAGTVPPKEVNRAFTVYKNKYPEKRFIVHYMQPHAPYLHYQPKYQFTRSFSFLNLV